MEELVAEVDDTLVVVAQSNVRCATKQVTVLLCFHWLYLSKCYDELNTCAGSMFNRCLLCYSHGVINLCQYSSLRSCHIKSYSSLCQHTGSYG